VVLKHCKNFAFVEQKQFSSWKYRFLDNINGAHKLKTDCE